MTIEEINSRIAVKTFPTSRVITLQGVDESWYQSFMAHLEDLHKVYESLIDDESKKAFYGYWLGNISHQWGEFNHSSEAHYLTAGFIPEQGSIVIEGGAFDGGSAATFADMGCKVYTFEMDSKNFEMAKKIAAEKNFVVENLGLGSYDHEMNYKSLISGSHLSVYGDNTAKITTIDNYVREKNLPRVDFIKLDVEGAELATLKGAKVTIARFKPILSLSAYHKLDDFWTLMNFAKSIRPDYEFAMRHYPITPEDEPDYFKRYSTSYGTDYERLLDSFELDPYGKQSNECCLLAR